MKTGHHEYHISKHNIYVFLLINILCERNIVTEINCSLFHFWLSFKGCLIREHYCSVVKVVSDSLQPHELQHTRLPCHSLCLWVCSNSCPLSQWGHPTISSSVTPVSFCPQSSPASESFPMSWLFTSDGQSIGVSASVLPMNIQGWFPLGLTGLISLLFKGLWRVFSSTTVGKHQFFGTQPSLWSNSHIHRWLLKKT